MSVFNETEHESNHHKCIIIHKIFDWTKIEVIASVLFNWMFLAQVANSAEPVKLCSWVKMCSLLLQCGNACAPTYVRSSVFVTKHKNKPLNTVLLYSCTHASLFTSFAWHELFEKCANFWTDLIKALLNLLIVQTLHASHQ